MAYRTDRPNTQPIRLEQWEVMFWNGVCIKGVPMPGPPQHLLLDDDGSVDSMLTSPLLDCMGNLMRPTVLGTDPYEPAQIAELLEPGMTVRTFRGSTYVLGERAR